MTKASIKHLTKDVIRESALKELRWRGFDVWRQNNIAVRGRAFIGRKGVPDVIGIDKQCKWVVCEVKTANDRLSHEQIDFLNQIVNQGGTAFIAKQSPAGAVVLEPWEVK